MTPREIEDAGNRVLNYIIIVALTIIFVVVGAYIVQASGSMTTAGSGVWTDQAGHNLRAVTANLRDYPGGWTATDPNGHSALGIESVECLGVTGSSPGALIVHLSPAFQGGLTVWAQVDERYVRKGVLTGLWLNPDSIGIRLKQVTSNGIAALNCYDPILVDPNANIWLGGLGLMPAPTADPTVTP